MSSEINLQSSDSSKPNPLFKGLLWAGAVLIVLVAVNYFFPFLRQSKEATLVLAYEDGGKGRVFQGPVIDGMTILDALITSSKAGQIELKYGLNENGKMRINSLDGYDRATSEKILVFYLNNQKIDQELINSTPIKPGDNIEVRLE